MQDFIRIGGEITSNPLNENFRTLRNQISISNTNLIFSEEKGIVNTIADMEAIQTPDNGQACYVVSSGELYRYNKKDAKWYKIADFGQTFRQGFLNSGAVVLEDYIKLKENTNATLQMPNMLVYFKNKEGDERYLKGMYLIEAKEVDLSATIDKAMAYSILVDMYGNYTVITGLPAEDNPNRVFIGSFLTNSDKKIIRDFIYTLPDMAYTADRGNFLINGGQASGLTLYANAEGGKKVSRKSGYYYDEGINFTKGQTSSFPVDNDNGSNFDLKAFKAEELADELIYLTPHKSLENDIIITSELIVDKYWDGEKIANVPEGMATIQFHLVTPAGQNIILYGDKLYNSFADAAMNLNSVGALDLNFPFVEATRIILVNTGWFSTTESQTCNFYGLTRLAQVGTISPVFGDEAFELYSGDSRDSSPSRLRFSLDELQDDKFEGMFTAALPRYKVTLPEYSLEYKYISEDYQGIVETVQKIQEQSIREYNSMPGFVIGDANDIRYIHNRVSDIEKEIWENYRENEEIYHQSIRYRLDATERTAISHGNRLTIAEQDINNLELTKVHKKTSINNYLLGDETNNEIYTIELKTGDISEGPKKGEDSSSINLWYREDRVRANDYVSKAYEHANTISTDNNVNPHMTVNPHNLSTDDIKILSDTDRLFLTKKERDKLLDEHLPEDTWKEIRDLQAKDAELDEKKIEHVIISTLNRDNNEVTHIADTKELRFITDGAVVTTNLNGSITTVECVGQTHGLMKQSDYATKEQTYYPELFNGEHFVDNALNAKYASIIKGLDEYAGPNQYYGTDDSSTVGVYDLPVYVSTVEGSQYDNVTDVILTPDEGSVVETSLSEDLRNKINNNYHTVIHNGEEKSSVINKFRFGDNLDVAVDENDSHTIVINSTGAGGSEVRNFVNLTDVLVSYEGNAGKILVVNGAETGVTLANAPALDQFMEKGIYVNPENVFQVLSAKNADYATNAGYADSADLAAKANNAFALDSVTIDNTKTTNYLWTASQIISNTSSQIEAEGVKVYHGTVAPSNDLGKDGDIYILIEE